MDIFALVFLIAGKVAKHQRAINNLYCNQLSDFSIQYHRIRNNKR